MDRGTIPKGRWQLRIHVLAAWAKGPYQQAFNAASLIMVVIATPGEKRAANLLSWTQEALTAAKENLQVGGYSSSGAEP